MDKPNITLIGVAISKHEEELQIEHLKKKRDYEKKHGVKLKHNRPYSAIEANGK